MVASTPIAGTRLVNAENQHAFYVFADFAVGTRKDLAKSAEYEEVRAWMWISDL